MTQEDFVEYYSFLNHLWEKDEDFKAYTMQVWRKQDARLKVNKYGANNMESSPDRLQFSPPVMNKRNPGIESDKLSEFEATQTKPQHIEEDRQSQLSGQSKNSQKGWQAKNITNNIREPEFDRQSQQSQQSKRGQPQIGPASRNVDNETQSMCSQATSTRFMQENKISQRQIELILIRIKNRLASKGPRGFLAIERILKIADTDSDGRLSQAEFKKSIRDLRIDVTDSEIDIIFNLFDASETGFIDLFEFTNALKGQMNQNRYNIVNEVFNKIDQQCLGTITFADIQREYYPRAHPDVKTTKKHEDDVAEDFFSTLELHNRLYSEVDNDEVSREQFLDYFNNVSASIQDDQLFESILVNTFRLSHQNSLVNKYAGQRNAFDPEKNGFLQDHHRIMVNGGTVSSNAPFGTTEEPTQYVTQLRPYSASSSQAPSTRGFHVSQPNMYPNRAGQKQDYYERFILKVAIVYRDNQSVMSQQQSTMSQQQSTTSQQQSTTSQQQSPLGEFKKRLNLRGVRGFIKLYQKFRSVLKDHQGVISFAKFEQTLSELRLQTEGQLEIFQEFSKQGSLVLEDFFKALKGKISEHRQALIVHAFQGMDKTRCGEVSLDLLKRTYIFESQNSLLNNLYIFTDTYDSVGHPNVKLGKISDEEAYSDFIDAFEFHMSIFVIFNISSHFCSQSILIKNSNNLNRGIVHFNEFFEFYHITSQTIQDEQFFELMMRNCWNIKTY